MKNIKLLLVSENPKKTQLILETLASLGLSCSTTHISNAFQTLYLAEQNQQPFQIVMILGERYDHHIANLGRAIKESILLGPIMISLALENELFDYEKERVYFDGFACIFTNAENDLNPLTQQLANSWRSWEAKIDFSKPLIPVKNRILLVEDDPIAQRVNQARLMKLGCQVDIASDGHDAFKLLAKNDYSLIFMDIGLPDISGLDITAEIRKRENGIKHIPIIGLTIHELESDEKIGLTAGLDEYIIKPLTQDHLKGVLEKWGASAEGESFTAFATPNPIPELL